MSYGIMNSFSTACLAPFAVLSLRGPERCSDQPHHHILSYSSTIRDASEFSTHLIAAFVFHQSSLPPNSTKELHTYPSHASAIRLMARRMARPQATFGDRLATFFALDHYKLPSSLRNFNSPVIDRISDYVWVEISASYPLLSFAIH
jgi:hypothetical protein